jgi:hypothetical protein
LCVCGGGVWLFFWSLTFPTPYIFWDIYHSSMFSQNIMRCLKSCSGSGTSPTLINSCAKSAWYARHQHSYDIYKDFLSHNSWMKNRNFTKKYTDRKTINSNKCAKFEVNWPWGFQFTTWHTKNRLQFDE